LVAVLRLNGLVEKPVRGKGSHAWFEHPDEPTKCTTVPDRDQISRDLPIRILKQAGETRDEYQARLREV
jgi:predicted RNA binding protein YcfA (HicA-like mRNA interferase family)